MTPPYLPPLLLILQLLTGANSSYIAPATVQRLYSNLTSKYDARLRPTHDQSHQVLVSAFATPYYVVELSTSDQRLTLLLAVELIWWDQFLVWNSTLYDGIEKVTLNVGQIWHPKLMVGLKHADKIEYLGGDSDQQQQQQVTVQSNGSVLWVIDTIEPVVCMVDIAFYPFDTQKCSVTLFPPYTSWDEIHLYTIPDLDQPALVEENPEWHFLDTQSFVDYDEKTGETINYVYLFRRRAEFVVYTTIVPLVMLSVLNACVVLVPVSSGEKGSIAVTLFLSYCVYLTATAETLPPNSAKTSYLLLYMTIVQAFSALTMLYCIIQTRLYIHGSKLFKACIPGVSRCSRDKYKGNRNSNLELVEDTYARDVSESTKGVMEEPRSDETLDVHRRLDNVAFVTCLILNAVVVVVFAILTANSIQNKLETPSER